MKQRSGSIPSFPPIAPRSFFLHISMIHICSLQVVTPLTRHFSSSLQFLIPNNSSLYTLSGQLQGGDRGCAASIPRALCCAKLPPDPEIINIQKVRESGYNLFWWLLPILIAPTLWAWFVALPLNSWSKVSKLSLPGHIF